MDLPDDGRRITIKHGEETEDVNPYAFVMAAAKNMMEALPLQFAIAVVVHDGAGSSWVVSNADPHSLKRWVNDWADEMIRRHAASVVPADLASVVRPPREGG